MVKMTPEERIARLNLRRGAKIVWNREALDAATLGLADGLGELGAQIIESATSVMGPGHLDAPPYGEGLIASGTVSVWAKGKLVAGRTDVKASANKPRGLKVPPDQVVMIVGFNDPKAHLHELGTVHMIARPFLTPAFNKIVPGAESVVVPAMGKRIARVKA